MKAVVAYMNFFDNDLKQMVVEVDKKDWKEAYVLAITEGVTGSKVDKEEAVKNVSRLSNNIEDAKRDSFDGEELFEVTFI